MTGADILKEYLVKVGFTIDSPTQVKLKETLASLDAQLNKMSKNQSFIALSKGALGFVGALAAVTVATAGLLNKVAESHMAYEKLALSMHTTKQIARELSVAQEAVGASFEEIAWIPELREHYIEMRNLVSQSNVPKEAEQIWKTIRGIGHEFSKLKILVKQAGEWIAYHIGKYMGKDLQGFKKWLSDTVTWIKENLPKITKIIADVLMRIIGVATVIKNIFVAVYKGIKSVVEVLPMAATAFIAFFGAIALGLKLNPVFLMLSGLFLLLEDYWVWSQGKEKGYKTYTMFDGLWESLESLKEGMKDTGIGDIFKELTGQGLNLTILKALNGILSAIATSIGFIAYFFKDLVAMAQYAKTMFSNDKIKDIGLETQTQLNELDAKYGKGQKTDAWQNNPQYMKERAAIEETERQKIALIKKQSYLNLKAEIQMNDARFVEMVETLNRHAAALGEEGGENIKQGKKGGQKAMAASVSNGPLPQAYMNDKGKGSINGAAIGSEVVPFNVTINVPPSYSPDDRLKVADIVAQQVKAQLIQYQKGLAY